MSAFLKLAIILFLKFFRCISLQCLDEDGDGIDWFFVYKVNKGLDYSYYDAKSTASGLTVAANKVISDKDTAIGATLSQIWNNEKDKIKSPKRFRFYGRITLDEPWTVMMVKEDKALDVNESVLTLEFEENTGFKYMRIEYDVNDEATMTRIYRIRIHAET